MLTSDGPLCYSLIKRKFSGCNMDTTVTKNDHDVIVTLSFVLLRKIYTLYRLLVGLIHVTFSCVKAYCWSNSYIFAG